MNPTDTAEQIRRLRRTSAGVWAVFVLGLLVSVAANVLHADKNIISQAIAAWAPLALLLSVELIARVPVRTGWRSWFRIAATGAVAAIAGWVSYWHMVGVAAAYGETGIIPYLLPVSVDGMIVVATITLVEISAKIRHLETTDPAPVDTPPADTPTVDHLQAETVTNPAPQLAEPPATAPVNPPPVVEPADSTSVDNRPAVPAPLLPQARLIATAHQQATGAPITAADLASRMGTTTSTAAALLAAINTASTPAPQPARINGTAVEALL